MSEQLFSHPASLEEAVSTGDSRERVAMPEFSDRITDREGTRRLG